MSTRGIFPGEGVGEHVEGSQENEKYLVATFTVWCWLKKIYAVRVCVCVGRGEGAWGRETPLGETLLWVQNLSCYNVWL